MWKSRCGSAPSRIYAGWIRCANVCWKGSRWEAISFWLMTPGGSFAREMLLRVLLLYVTGRIPAPMADRDRSQQREAAGAVDDDQRIGLIFTAVGSMSFLSRGRGPVTDFSSHSLLTSALNLGAAAGAGSPWDNRPPVGLTDRINVEAD